MCKCVGFPSILFCLIGLFLIGVSFLGDTLLSGPSEIITPTERSNNPFGYRPDVSHLLDVCENIVSMFVTIVFGLFVVMGVCLRSVDWKIEKFGIIDGALVIGFILASFVSLYCGYWVRAQSFDLLARYYVDISGFIKYYSSLRVYLSAQAFFAAIASMFSLCVCAKYFTRKGN